MEGDLSLNNRDFPEEEFITTGDIGTLNTEKPIRSVSQFLQYSRCAKQYKYIYRDKATRRSSLSMLCGSTVHKAIEVFLKSRLEKGLTLTEIEIKKEVMDYWNINIPHITRQHNEDPEQLLIEANKLIGVVYPWLLDQRPLYSELQIVHDDPNKPFVLRGIIDYIDEDHKLIDFKTSSKTPAQTYRNSGVYKLSFDHELQLTIYKWLFEQNKNVEIKQTSVIYLVKNEDPKLIEVVGKIDKIKTDSALKWLEEIEKYICMGAFPSNRPSFFCSSKLCSFWEICTGLT